MNRFKHALDVRGLTVNEVSKRGLDYSTVRKHYIGERGIGPQSALLYERALGIPRSELRPDLWAASVPTTTPSSSAEQPGEGAALPAVPLEQAQGIPSANTSATVGGEARPL